MIRWSQLIQLAILKIIFKYFFWFPLQLILIIRINWAQSWFFDKGRASFCNPSAAVWRFLFASFSCIIPTTIHMRDSICSKYLFFRIFYLSLRILSFFNLFYFRFLYLRFDPHVLWFCNTGGSFLTQLLSTFCLWSRGNAIFSPMNFLIFRLYHQINWYNETFRSFWTGKSKP